MSSEITREKVVSALSGVIEPDFGKDIVSLNLIAGIEISEGLIKLDVKSSSPALHARKRMQEAVEFALERAFGAEVKTEVKV
ncbi:MAG: iron-sulfur cluster assembly protein, partial [Flavobacteriales bacterium]